ncbi:ribosomal protection-like ABC-F family protein [Planococcus sp. CAU13]|uniref:ribosomal protection-like ABC-F family protein n=1 Tax=Planococcus sp. CAU13 TaxID=1541197 RepID=UPI00052FFBC7|nr:ABC-F family ATP-binding cassette domain-containing protein [Planococcus sp. CAU13]
MAVIGKLNKLTISHRDRVIVREVDAMIHKYARIAVIGANGSGKSSLLEAIAAGGNGIQWIGRKPEIIFMEQEAKKLDNEHFDSAARALERKFGIPENRSELSGGETMKLRIARVLARPADLFLLDEPTNHLDAESLGLLAEEVEHVDGTVIFVSHDRHFIDEVATHIWEIENHQLTVYEGNYSAARKEKEHRRLTQQRKYEKQQAKIAQVESQIMQLQSWSDKAHRESTKKDGAKEYYRVKAKKKDVQIRSKRQRLEAELEQDRIEQPGEEAEVIFSIMDASKKGRRVIELKDAGKGFGNRVLFERANFTVQHGERVGLLGNNGSGKSTLLKMILGQMEHKGEVWISEGMRIGYLSQDVYDLPENKTPAELFPADNFEEAGRIRNLMDHLGFEKMHWQQKVSVMSMGERVKLKLMEFMLSGCNVLLLDEPTNHLDLPSREELERALASFGGTMLIATHDRYFMGKLSGKLLVFENNRLSKYEGGYTDWLDREKVDEQLDLLQLDRERQEVLGKLSYMKPSDKEYRALDMRFNELTVAIQSLTAAKKN